MKKHYTSAIFLSCVLWLSNADAAVYDVIGGTLGGQVLYGIGAFEDGQATQVTWSNQCLDYRCSSTAYVEDAEWVLANGPANSASILISFLSGAPFVDTVNHTIDVSGIYVHGVYSPGIYTGAGYYDGYVYEEAIGWQAGPAQQNPILYTIGSDGSYTASWVYYNNIFGYSDTMSITFQASAVPLPAATWLFGSGLIGLLSFARRRAFGG